jgi:hypothetical protein
VKEHAFKSELVYEICVSPEQLIFERTSNMLLRERRMIPLFPLSSKFAAGHHPIFE